MIDAKREPTFTVDDELDPVGAVRREVLVVLETLDDDLVKARQIIATSSDVDAIKAAHVTEGAIAPLVFEQIATIDAFVEAQIRDLEVGLDATEDRAPARTRALIEGIRVWLHGVATQVLPALTKLASAEGTRDHAAQARTALAQLVRELDELVRKTNATSDAVARALHAARKGSKPS